jgi:hypothetical protein
MQSFFEEALNKTAMQDVKYVWIKFKGRILRIKLRVRPF